MRTSAAPLLLALLALAAPLAGQTSKERVDPVFRTPAFEIKLPPGFGTPVEQRRSEEGTDLTLHYAVGPGGVLMVVQARLPVAVPLDTALAAQRQVLQMARTGMLQAAAYRELGEPREIVRAGRLSLRIPVSMHEDGAAAAYGLSELTLPLGGEIQFWMVAYLGPTRETVDAPEAKRVLESFRLREGAFAAAPRDTSDVFRWVEGTWDWTDREESCSDNPFTLSVAPDRGTVRLEYRRAPAEGDTARVFTYRVLGHGADHIRGEIQGETRRDEAGAPVTWDFVRLSADLFCWRRGGWTGVQCTAPIRRCTAPPAVPAPGRSSR